MNDLLDVDVTEGLLPEVAEGQLAVDIFETADSLIIQSVIAGVTADDLEIFVNVDMVTIRGNRVRDVRRDTAEMHYEECFWGEFSRTVVLPVHISPSETSSELKNGVLTITMPKEDSDGRFVPIND